MRNCAASLLMIVILAMPFSAEALPMYKWVDQWGTTHFTDDIHTIPEGVEAKKLGDSRVSLVMNPHYNLSTLSVKVPYILAGKSMIVTAKINGVLMRMVLDTGASLVVIPPAIVRRAGISTKGVKRIDVYTANGKVNVPSVTIRQMQTGNMTMQNVPAIVQTVNEDPEIGLLGMSYLERFNFQIDQKRNLLLLQKR